jgi:hypothetical protein
MHIPIARRSTATPIANKPADVTSSTAISSGSDTQRERT